MKLKDYKGRKFNVGDKIKIQNKKLILNGKVIQEDFTLQDYALVLADPKLQKESNWLGVISPQIPSLISIASILSSI